MTGLCSIDGCKNKRMARGWCRKHYHRWYNSQGGHVQTRAYARERAFATHCQRGHKYTEADTDADGKRRCRTCSADRSAERRRWDKTRLRDELSVDESEYNRRRNKLYYEKMNGALTGPPRTSKWTPVEDAIIVRDDIFIVEKVAMLQRSAKAVMLRERRLRTPVRPCAVCGKGFHARAEVLCCSQACAAVHRRTIFPIPCVGCGEEFQPQKSTQKYCTKDCLISAKAARFDVPCEHCGAVFRQRITGQRFCSQLCMGIARRTVAPKPCLHCGTEFKSRERSQMYCSNRCRYEAVRSASAAKRKPRSCPRCGSTAVKAGNKYCSYSCSVADSKRPPAPCVQQCGQSNCLHSRPCLRCSEVFKPRDFQSKYCSRQCAGSAKVKRLCAHCGLCAVPSNNKKYCSKACTPLANAKRKRSPKPCAQCGTEFKPSNAASKYCSMRCSADSQVMVANVNCRTCGVEYRPQRRKAGNLYCSRKCYGISLRKTHR